MSSQTTDLSLTIWDQSTDLFDYQQLATNFTNINNHDHTGSGKGKQLQTGAIANSAITSSKLATGLSPALVTSLPTTDLYDGYTVDYTNSLTAPTYVWRLRYQSGITGTYKWVFVGGSHLSSYSTSTESTVTVDSYTYTVSGAGSTTQQSLTLPLTGVYQIRFGAKLKGSGGSGKAVYMGLHSSSTTDSLISGDNSIGTAEIKIDRANSETSYQAVTRQIRYTAATAITLYAKYKVDVPQTGTLADRWISVQPIAVI